MTLQIFALFDKKAIAFMPPFFYQQKGEALRAFSELANDGKSSPSKYPEDFSLFHLGEYDDQKGVISPKNPPVHVEEALTLKKS
ncbi:MAG: nonstructural protein [Arizlama microvirus]|nr:MAG: nonstructural protein [Arizlama microvirus]